MKRSFEEILKFSEEDKSYQEMVMRSGRTSFSEFEFWDRASNETIIILRWDKVFGVDAELAYGLSVLSAYGSYAEKAFRENTLVEINKDEFTKTLEGILGGLNFKYEIKPWRDDISLRYYKIQYPDPDNFIELIQETRDLVIYINWASAA